MIDKCRLIKGLFLSDNIYVARQPIVTVDKKLYGYELLFRSIENDGLQSAQFSDGTIASTRVAVNVLNHIGLQRVAGDELAFINADEHFIMSDAILSLPRGRFVIELLETIEVNDETIGRIIELKKLGFHFALDGASCDLKYKEKFKAIFSYIDILKLDSTLINKQEFESKIEELNIFNFEFLVEKIETLEEFEYFKKLGCSYFQGYFFAKPDLLKQKALDPMYKEIFRLINILDEEGSIDEISTAFEESPDVTIQLLKFMNSGILNMKSNIRSIKHAIALLGRKPLKQWLFLITFSKSEVAVDGMRSPVIILAQSRAKLMSELASTLKSSDIDVHEASLVGILSLVDVITEAPLEDILEELTVSSSIKEALLKNRGKFAELLELTISIETSNIEKSNTILSKLKVSNESLKAAILESYNI